MRLVIFLVALLLPIASSAAPVIIVAIAAYAGYVSVAAVIFTAISYTMQQSQKKKQNELVTTGVSNVGSISSAIEDRNSSGVSSDQPHKYVYGEARIGCNIVAMFSSGTHDSLKHLVCVICQHEIEAIDEVYLNGKAVGNLDGSGLATASPYGSQTRIGNTVTNTGSHVITLPTSDCQDLHVYYTVQRENTSAQTIDGSLQYVTTAYDEDIQIPFTAAGATITYGAEYDDTLVKASYTTIQQNSYLRIKKHLGVPGEAADADLISEVPSKWTSNSKLSGHAYIYIRLDQRLSEFQNGVPNVEVLIRGKKLYDPRTTTTYYSANPALVARDYITSPMCNIASADVPESKFIAAANDCDDPMASLASAARYTFNGVITSEQNQSDVLSKIAQSMAGGIVATSWDIYAGKYSAPVMSILQEDIVGEISVSPGFAFSDTYNTVKGRFISAANEYQPNDYVPYQNATFIALDGGITATSVDFPYTNTQQRVTNLARIIVEDNRNAFSISGDFSLKTWSLAIGDRVTLTSEFLGQSARIFRVTDKAIKPDGVVTLGLKEDAESIYDEADQQAADATPNSDFANPFSINPLTGLACESGTDQLIVASDGSITSRIKASWDAATTPSVLQNGIIEVEWIEAGNISTGNWSRTVVSGSQTYAYINPVVDAKVHFVRARTVNPVIGVKSEWSTITHFVIGKSEPPPDVASFSIDGSVLSWAPVNVVDLQGYRLKFNFGANLDWGIAAPLVSGVVLSPPYDLVTRPSGPVTIMIKAVDTSGNESLNAISIQTDLGDSPVANVLETFTFDPAFAGTKTNCTVSGGDLLADANDSFYGDDDQSFYGPEADNFYESGTYKQLQYTTDEFSVSAALAGSQMTMSLGATGTDIYVEYRTIGTGSFYGVDGDSFYGPDADSLYTGPSAWTVWPGSIAATNGNYQFRVTIGAGGVQGAIQTMAIIIDAPDIEESLADVTIAAAGTVPSYTKTFSVIKTIQLTLQTNASGAESVEVDKTVNLAPVIKAFNSSHAAVSGAKVDITIKGY